jgi:hypothetical protein
MRHPKLNRPAIFSSVLLVTLLLLSLPAVSHLLQPRPRQQVSPARTEPYVSVIEFGANGKDDAPDADAIQRAIDSLPKPSGVGTKAPCGGVVVLPAGRYLLNKSLRVFSGVTLRGEGPGTVVYSPGAEPAILIISPFTHGYCPSATIEDLTIYTDKSAGIVADKSVTNLVQCRFENLLISAGGCAIDLDPSLAHKTYTQNTVVRNVFVSTFGGPALQLWGNANHIEQICTEGGTRTDFKADPAIVTIAGGGNDIRSCIIEANRPNPAVAFCISGTFTWSHNWVELDPVKDGIAYIFKDVEVAVIDNLHHLLPWHKPKFVNCTSVQIRVLNTDGELAPLSANLDLDEKSNLRIDQVIARTDVGMLDDPRVSIGSIYNKLGGWRLDVAELKSHAAGTNLVENTKLQDMQSWQVKWDTPLGNIRGDAKPEPDPSNATQKRMRVEIKENPNKRPLGIEVKLRVGPEIAGKQAVAQWRVEGPGQVGVFQNGKEIPSRAMGSLTANVLPAPVKEGDVLEFILPPEPGTYFISDVAVYPK